MKILMFNFEELDKEVNLLVSVDRELWENTSVTKNQIDDAIASYIDDVMAWTYEVLITDVLQSFGLDFEFVEPITFYI